MFSLPLPLWFLSHQIQSVLPRWCLWFPTVRLPLPLIRTALGVVSYLPCCLFACCFSRQFFPLVNPRHAGLILTFRDQHQLGCSALMLFAVTLWPDSPPSCSPQLCVQPLWATSSSLHPPPCTWLAVLLRPSFLVGLCSRPRGCVRIGRERRVFSWETAPLWEQRAYVISLNLQ